MAQGTYVMAPRVAEVELPAHDPLLEAFHDARLLLPSELPKSVPIETGKWVRCKMWHIGNTTEGAPVWFARG